MAQMHRQTVSTQITHTWGQDPGEVAGDSSVIAPWLDDNPDITASLEPVRR